MQSPLRSVKWLHSLHSYVLQWVTAGLEIRFEKGTAKMGKVAAGVCYFNGAFTRVITAISEDTAAIAASAVGYFEPCDRLY